VDEQRLSTNDPTVAPSNVTTCNVDQQWVGRVAVMAVSGTVDMLTAPHLGQAIRAALDENPAGLVIDFSDVEFLASAGMAVLVTVHDEVTPDMRFCVVADGPATSRPLKLVGIADLIKLYATRDEALSALSA
jgi:anti-anti-sigma factor